MEGGGLQQLQLGVMAGNGRGSINHKLERFRSAGEREGQAKILLDNTISDVRKLVLKPGRTPLTNIAKKLNEVVEATEIVSATLKKLARRGRRRQNAMPP